jgi:hypothetical protein
VRRAIAIDVAPARNEPEIPLCSFAFTSRSGVRTDLVVGPWNGGAIADVRLQGRRRFVVTGLGDRAVFLQAESLDDGNSILLVTAAGRSFLVGSEFLSLAAAKQLAETVLQHWR